MPKPMSDKLSPALRQRLNDLGYKHLTDLSERSNVPRETVRYIFTRNKLESVRAFLVLAKTLNLPPDELINLIAN